ncbi:ATP-dependent Clp protease adaptor ClpS [Bailinhaonella thermotolerans]|nr:ATP-dependent Clp protease adaptor ClpS [Bailinhaonella thermotolerans]
MPDQTLDRGTGTAVLERPRTEPPWSVIVLNDDVTPMNYVVLVFQKILKVTADQAEALMLEVHTTGQAVVFSGPRAEADDIAAQLLAAHLRAKVEKAG